MTVAGSKTRKVPVSAVALAADANDGLRGLSSIKNSAHVSESTWRIWRLYMAACALEFESGEIGVYQVLANKRTGCPASLPLTRKHLYGA